MIETFLLRELAERALAEDLIYGDRTTDSLFPDPIPAVASLIAKEDLVVAGLDIFQTVFRHLDPSFTFELRATDGQSVKKDEMIFRVVGDGRLILKAERTALNFIQRLSGIATFTRQYVKAIEGTSARVVDTRKTTPLFRALEKQAVALGGGGNHRFHLGDLILIKDNHIALAGGIKNAVSQARSHRAHSLKIEVETNTLAEVAAALDADVDLIMLDNMDLEDMKTAVARIRGKSPSILIEASGGMSLEGLRAVAECGVDLISVGALTHSARAVDMSLDIEKA